MFAPLPDSAFPLWTLIALCLGLVAFLMALASWTSRAIANYGLTDAIWAFSFVLVAPVAIVFAPGYGPRKLLIGSLFAVWGLRLVASAARSAFSRPGAPDARNAGMRGRFGSRVGPFALGQLRAAWAILLLAPLFVAVRNAEEGLNPFEILGAVLWLAGLIGETVADFRSPSASPPPHWLFETVLWAGYGVFALGSPGGWVALYAPVLRWLSLAPANELRQ